MLPEPWIAETHAEVRRKLWVACVERFQTWQVLLDIVATMDEVRAISVMNVRSDIGFGGSRSVGGEVVRRWTWTRVLSTREARVEVSAQKEVRDWPSGIFSKLVGCPRSKNRRRERRFS